MKVIHFLVIFILATTCSTLKVPVMSGQLKVTYQTTASENHSCNKLFCSLWCHFILRKHHFYQCIPTNSHFRSKLLACRYETLQLHITGIHQAGGWCGKKYMRVKWYHISLRLKVNIDYCRKFLFLDNWSWGKKCSTCLMFHTSFF